MLRVTHSICHEFLAFSNYCIIIFHSLAQFYLDQTFATWVFDFFLHVTIVHAWCVNSYVFLMNNSSLPATIAQDLLGIYGKNFIHALYYLICIIYCMYCIVYHFHTFFHIRHCVIS